VHGPAFVIELEHLKLAAISEQYSAQCTQRGVMADLFPPTNRIFLACSSSSNNNNSWQAGKLNVGPLRCDMLQLR